MVTQLISIANLTVKHYVNSIKLGVNRHHRNVCHLNQFKKTNENTSMSEGANVGLTDEAIAVVSSRLKNKLKRRERF